MEPNRGRGANLADKSREDEALKLAKEIIQSQAHKSRKSAEVLVAEAYLAAREQITALQNDVERWKSSFGRTTDVLNRGGYIDAD